MFSPISVVKQIPSWAYVLAAAGVALYVVKKGGIQNAAQGATAAVVGTAGDIIKGLTSGMVLGAGDVIGVPRTNINACKNAINSANNAKASAYCSAGVFAKWQYFSTRQRLSGKTFTMTDIFN